MSEKKLCRNLNERENLNNIFNTIIAELGIQISLCYQKFRKQKREREEKSGFVFKIQLCECFFHGQSKFMYFESVTFYRFTKPLSTSSKF